MNLKQLLFIPIALLTIASCNKLEEPEFIGVKETKIESLNFKDGVLKVLLEFNNPNNFGIEVKETNLEVYVNDKFLGIAEQGGITSIPKNSKFDFPVRVHFNPMKAMGIAMNDASKKTLPLHIKGTARAGKKGVFIKVPIDFSDEISIR